MEYTFKNHRLSEAEKMWLIEVSRSSPFDPRIAKVKLYGKLPGDFDPNRIDSRLYANGRLTPIGLWHVDPGNTFLKEMDQVIQAIREMILEAPGIESVAATNVAVRAGLDEQKVGRAFYEIGQLGHFFSRGISSIRPFIEDVYASIQLEDATAYDEYLRYDGLDDLLERVYIARKPSMGLF